MRRLTIECPQKPGIILAVTELLKDRGCSLSEVLCHLCYGICYGIAPMLCSLSEVDANTRLMEGTVWFTLKGIVDFPAGAGEHDLHDLEEQFDVWRDTLPPPAKLHLDEWLPSHTPLAAA